MLGTGVRGDGPETDPLQCKLSRPHGLFADTDGTLYVTDSEAHRIRVLGSADGCGSLALLAVAFAFPNEGGNSVCSGGRPRSLRPKYHCGAAAL